ncbi:MAG TPA: hypothetical protein VNN09_09905, partial [Candidatus Competibacteraceae bacterium]|nr:hypothetical protein [Candidatus Competibacteraceae bacterium]
MSEKTTLDSGQRMAIEGLPEARGALLELLRDSRRQLLCYSPLIDERLYDDAQVVEALRQKLVRQPRWRLALLLPPTRQWRPACPCLNALLERLSSAIELR